MLISHLKKPKPQLLKIVIALAAASVLCNLVIYVQAKRAASNPTVAQAVATQKKADIKQKYEPALVTILKDFTAAPPETRAQIAASTKDKILNLTVPVEYKDLDLGLVLALSSIQQGKVSDGIAAYSKAVAPYPCLSGVRITQ